MFAHSRKLVILYDTQYILFMLLHPYILHGYIKSIDIHTIRFFENLMQNEETLSCFEIQELCDSLLDYCYDNPYFYNTSKLLNRIVSLSYKDMQQSFKLMTTFNEYFIDLTLPSIVRDTRALRCTQHDAFKLYLRLRLVYFNRELDFNRHINFCWSWLFCLFDFISDDLHDSRIVMLNNAMFHRYFDRCNTSSKILAKFNSNYKQRFMHIYQYRGMVQPDNEAPVFIETPHRALFQVINTLHCCFHIDNIRYEYFFFIRTFENIYNNLSDAEKKSFRNILYNFTVLCSVGSRVRP